jgi:transcriptional regulator with XRE-family HTH domain
VVISSVRDMQVLARTRRLDLRLTQQQAAERAGVSRKWLVNFESGTATAVELALVLRLFAVLEIPLTTSSPDSTSPRENEQEPTVDLGDHLDAVTARSERILVDFPALVAMTRGRSEAMQRLAVTLGPDVARLAAVRESLAAADRHQAEELSADDPDEGRS